MRPGSWGRGVLALTLGGFGCSAPKPGAAPAPVAEASAAGGLRPLSSRDEAKPLAGPEAARPELPPGHPAVASGSAEGALGGTVSIAPGIVSRSSPTDILYLIARRRATNAVVAVRREEGVTFPHAFELSSADAMVPDQPFVGPFEVTARLSKSGDALPAKGDLEGTASGVAEGARHVALVIDRVRE